MSNIISFQVETDAEYDNADLANALDAFKEFIGDMDDDAQPKSAKVEFMTVQAFERKAQQDIIDALNDSEIKLTASIGIPNAPSPYVVELESKE